MKQTDFIVNILKYAASGAICCHLFAQTALSWQVDQTSSVFYVVTQNKNKAREDVPTVRTDSRDLRATYNLLSHTDSREVNQQHGVGFVGGVDFHDKTFYEGSYTGSWEHSFRRSSLGFTLGTVLSRDEGDAYKPLLTRQEEATYRRYGINVDATSAKKTQVSDNALLQGRLLYNLDLTSRWRGSITHSWQQYNTKTTIVGEKTQKKPVTTGQLSQLQTDYQLTADIAGTLFGTYSTTNGGGKGDTHTRGAALVGQVPLPSSLNLLWSVGHTTSRSGHRNQEDAVGQLSLGENPPNQRLRYSIDVGRSIVRNITEDRVRLEDRQRVATSDVYHRESDRKGLSPFVIADDIYRIDQQQVAFSYDLTARLRSTLQMVNSNIRPMFSRDNDAGKVDNYLDSRGISWVWHHDLFGSQSSNFSGGINQKITAETLVGRHGRKQEQLSTTLFYDMIF